MRKIRSLGPFSSLAALLLVATSAGAVVPLIAPPSWRSTDNDYATGGALLDVDGDGFLDLVTACGNDMARQPVRVYKNEGGLAVSSKRPPSSV